MADTIPPATKTRTIAHMNKDHRADLAHILQHFNGISVVNPELIEMVDIDLEAFTVRVAGTGATSGHSTMYVVRFDPPMEKWDDRRHRLIDMTMRAREALGVVTEGDGGEHGNGGHGGVSGKLVPVREYLAPRGTDILVFGGVVLYWVSYSIVRAGIVDDGAVPAAWVDWIRFPGGAAGYRWLTELILYPVLGIHLAEMWWFDRTRLAKHGVPRGSLVWWLWMGSLFFEGAPAFVRFDRAARRKAREVERKGK